MKFRPWREFHQAAGNLASFAERYSEIRALITSMHVRRRHASVHMQICRMCVRSRVRVRDTEKRNRGKDEANKSASLGPQNHPRSPRVPAILVADPAGFYQPGLAATDESRTPGAAKRTSERDGGRAGPKGRARRSGPSPSPCLAL